MLESSRETDKTLSLLLGFKKIKKKERETPSKKKKETLVRVREKTPKTPLIVLLFVPSYKSSSSSSSSTFYIESLTAFARKEEGRKEMTTRQQQRQKVIVVGGGLAGLSAAHTVLENGGAVLLLDKSAFLGGNSTKATSGINGMFVCVCVFLDGDFFSLSFFLSFFSGSKPVVVVATYVNDDDVNVNDDAAKGRDFFREFS